MTKDNLSIWAGVISILAAIGFVLSVLIFLGAYESDPSNPITALIMGGVTWAMRICFAAACSSWILAMSLETMLCMDTLDVQALTHRRDFCKGWTFLCAVATVAAVTFAFFFLPYLCLTLGAITASATICSSWMLIEAQRELHKFPIYVIDSSGRG